MQSAMSSGQGGGGVGRTFDIESNEFDDWTAIMTICPTHIHHISALHSRDCTYLELQLSCFSLEVKNGVCRTTFRWKI